MKKKGFTLIELLAVIVVLAIIALIATPIVMNTIKKSKKGAAERSADSFVKQVETTVETERLSGNIMEDGEYEITSDGNLCKDKSASCSDENKIKIEMNGTKPTSGKVKITNGIVQISTKLTVGDYDIKYNEDNKKYEATEKGSTSSTVVYRWSTDTIRIGDTIDPSDTTKYTKDPSTLGKDYYLKHVVDKDDKVTESYACAIFDNKEYCVRGGNSSFYGYAENEVDYTGNVLILKNLRDSKIESIGCFFNASNSSCSDDSVFLVVRSDGFVRVRDDNNNCDVSIDGISNCNIY